RSNTLVTYLPRLSEQLDKATAWSFFNCETLRQFSGCLLMQKFGDARRLTAAMRESRMTFVADSVHFFDQQIASANALDRLIDAATNFDDRAYNRTLDELKAIDAETVRITKCIANWDVELTHWIDCNIEPLVQQAEAKFAEAERLAQEASAIFKDKQLRIIMKEPRKIYPPSPQT
ncbi:MAG: hypothetical protein ABI874_02305, partial [Chloroflexota bacterium]